MFTRASTANYLLGDTSIIEDKVDAILALLEDGVNIPNEHQLELEHTLVSRIVSGMFYKEHTDYLTDAGYVVVTMQYKGNKLEITVGCISSKDNSDLVIGGKLVL